MAKRAADGSGGPASKKAKQDESACFSMKLDTHRVPMRLHSKNRARLMERFKDVPKGSVIVLQGAETQYRDATDHEIIVRQESYFQWAFGVKEPDCFGIIQCDTGKAILCIPRLPEEYAVWMGSIRSKEDFKESYEVDEVRFVDEIESMLAPANVPGKLYLLEGLNTDSKMTCKPAEFPGAAALADRTDKAKLHKDMTELRVIKTEEELEVMRYVTRVSSAAHVKVMQAAKAGMAEYQLESLFRHLTYAEGGCRFQAYTCICGAGINAAVLHYGHAGAPNDGVLEDGKLNLFDMGGEYHCYAADITCSFPTSGKFTPEQKDIYEAVLAGQEAAFAAIRPGVEWQDVHLITEKAMMQVLKDRGYLQGDVEAMMAARLPAVFQPHGLGHLIGLDTHDVGGFPEGTQRSTLPGLKSLRKQGPLMEGMCITVEPGLYVIRHLLEGALKDEKLNKFLVPNKFERMLAEGFGGVRLEDDIIVTKDGYENMTIVPRKVADVEAVMAGAPWPPKSA